MNDELLERICFHESGHVAAALLYAIPIRSVSVEPPLFQRGKAPIRPPLDQLLTLCFAGGASEALYFGSDSGSSEDHAMAQRFASRRGHFLLSARALERAERAAFGLVRTDWGKRAIPRIADALRERGVLSGGDVHALFG
jgi:hypothetical protein